MGTVAMRRRNCISLFIGAACIWPHITFAQPQRTPAGADLTLARKTFTLGATSFAIFLPSTAVVDGSSVRDKVYIDMRKNSRDERVLILTISSHEPRGSYDQTYRLINGGHLEYRTEDDTGGGMGGPIAELTGRLEISSLAISVKCTDQDKWYRHPEWCLPYLNRMEFVEHSQ